MQITSKSSVGSPINRGASYSPDGQSLVFSSCSPFHAVQDAPGDCALYRIRADGTGKAIKVVGGKGQHWTHPNWRR